jgi:hypothetical protein
MGLHCGGGMKTTILIAVAIFWAGIAIGAAIGHFML